tara:strand:- start:2254 stop:2958 length:705 start_codon:yes stop_codon:yes gene_type:complete
MATLTGNKVKDTYQSLLKLETGTASSSYKVIEDGQGNNTGLKISTAGVEVEALKFTTDPATSSSELTALVYDGTTKEVKVRDLSSSAFSGGLSPATVYARVQTTFTIETGYSTPVISAQDNANAAGSYVFGGGDLSLDSSNKIIRVNTAGVYRMILGAHIQTTNSSRDITYRLLSGSTTLLEVERTKATADQYYDYFEYVSYFAAGANLKIEYKASGSGCGLREKSSFGVVRVQ